MKFYCIRGAHKAPHNEEAFNYLREACQQRGIEFVVLAVDDFDFSIDFSQTLETPSMLYRLGLGGQALLLEALLLKDGVATLYGTSESLFARGFEWGAVIRMQKTGLPVIPTIYNVNAAHDGHLVGYAEKLGGFPIILKAAGGSHGSAVMRIDSLESLRSVVGFVADRENARFVLRKFIPEARHIRLVVIGDKVADAIRYLPQANDFRTNAVSVPQVEAFPRTVETEYIFSIAERAVKELGLEFGGVDVLVDPEGNAYIAEINFPCNFARNQMNTGVDIAGMIVDYLMSKVVPQ